MEHAESNTSDKRGNSRDDEKITTNNAKELKIVLMLNTEIKNKCTQAKEDVSMKSAQK